jgi:hypothetical protein
MSKSLAAMFSSSFSALFSTPSTSLPSSSPSAASSSSLSPVHHRDAPSFSSLSSSFVAPSATAYGGSTASGAAASSDRSSAPVHVPSYGKTKSGSERKQRKKARQPSPLVAETSKAKNARARSQAVPAAAEANRKEEQDKKQKESKSLCPSCRIWGDGLVFFHDPMTVSSSASSSASSALSSSSSTAFFLGGSRSTDPKPKAKTGAKDDDWVVIKTNEEGNKLDMASWASEVAGLDALDALDAHERGLPSDGSFDPESTLGKWARDVCQSRENRSLELRNIMERMDSGGGHDGSIDVLPLACTCQPAVYEFAPPMYARQPLESPLPPVPDLPPLAFGMFWVLS